MADDPVAGNAPAEPVIHDPQLWEAIVPLVALAALIAAALALFGIDDLDGPIQTALVVCCGLAALIAMKNGHPFSAVQEAGKGAISSVTSAIFILLVVGAPIGVSPAITAGAVISGAYLGDKTSPLSETTILSAQLVGVDVHEHIKRQIWTSLPASRSPS